MHPFIEKLKENKKRTGNTLCVGLDPDPQKMPDFFPKTPHGIKEFLIEIIEATQEYCIAYKPNISFFEAYGIEGLKVLESLCHRIDSRIPIILDGKRGDIGNTAKMQAKFMFDYFGADACTVNPYMGEDSVLPFLNYRDNYTFVLSLTSNVGSQDFEKKILKNDTYLYEEVLSRCISWNQDYKNVGVVVGATQAELISIRKKDPSLLFLIPGVGAQGGSYAYASEHGGNNEGLSLINVSRTILYSDPSFIDTKNVIRKVIQNLVKA
jgi:orotidine-5'-phosphate decarboxylase